MTILKHKIAILRQKAPPLNYYTLQQSPRVAAAAGQLIFFEKSCILEKTQYEDDENQGYNNW
jgi:hypothetical protein